MHLHLLSTTSFSPLGGSSVKGSKCGAAHQRVTVCPRALAYFTKCLMYLIFTNCNTHFNVKAIMDNSK